MYLGKKSLSTWINHILIKIVLFEQCVTFKKMIWFVDFNDKINKEGYISIKIIINIALVS